MNVARIDPSCRHVSDDFEVSPVYLKLVHPDTLGLGPHFCQTLQLIHRKGAVAGVGVEDHCRCRDPKPEGLLRSLTFSSASRFPS